VIMKTVDLLKFSILIILIAGLAGCASYPDSVAVSEETRLVGFEQENQANVNKVGETARWSGVIADINNGKKQTTLDVLYYPAQSNGRPKTSKEPIGRFRVKVDKFLDPAIYRKGKSVTALGNLLPKETGKIGEYEYEYPTIGGAKVFLWPKLEPPPKVEFYYGWHGYNPRWYWHGGRRHVYIIGQGSKPIPAGKAKSSQNKN